ncbi:MAG: hypothetical protein Q8R06_07755 [Polaromonas sp.]|uniref:hypothetical protein n=1 Tax=Polaromonas sp. TaxID=1869339 RepID=UPI00273611F1|nr:hypothetical protein [Polaromonas sp.]MDP3797031.1 hypothetical protein [Polaromonas sp.]
MPFPGSIFPGSSSFIDSVQKRFHHVIHFFHSFRQHHEAQACLAANPLKDACGLTNPSKASQAEIEAIFRGAMDAPADAADAPRKPALETVAA